MKFLFVLFVLVSFSTAHADDKQYVIGKVSNPIKVGNRYFLEGWTCQEGVNQSLSIHIYAESSAYDRPRGVHVLSGAANQRNSGHYSEIRQRCKNNYLNHSFRVEIPHSILEQREGQKIYVHGLRKINGVRNEQLSGSGGIRFPAVPVGNVVGQVFAPVNVKGQYFLKGWACQEGISQSLSVDLYSGRSAYDSPKGTYVLRGYANLSNTSHHSAIRQRCQNNHLNHSFEIPIPDSVLEQWQGQKIYIHGLRKVNGVQNRQLDGSGAMVFPAPFIGEVIGEVYAPKIVGHDYFLEGWACQQAVNEPLSVHLYAENSAYGQPQGSYILSAKADEYEQGDQTKINAQCNNSFNNHSFKILLNRSTLRTWQGKKIYVHGIRKVNGVANSALTHSGDIYFLEPAEHQGTVQGQVSIVERYVSGGGRVFIEGNVCHRNAVGDVYLNARTIDAELTIGNIPVVSCDSGLSDVIQIELTNDVLREGEGEELLLSARDDIDKLSGSINVSGNATLPYALLSEASNNTEHNISPVPDPGELTGSKNAYPSEYFHSEMSDWIFVAWVWRNSSDVATNHSVSFAKTKDFENWFKANGEESITLPISLESGEIVDPVGISDGLLNNVKVSEDHQGNPIISYIKYDKNGNTQVYNAIYSGNQWKIFRASNWTARWHISGGGSLPRGETAVNFGKVSKGYDSQNNPVLYQSLTRSESDIRGLPRSGLWRLNENLNAEDQMAGGHFGPVRPSGLVDNIDGKDRIKHIFPTSEPLTCHAENGEIKAKEVVRVWGRGSDTAALHHLLRVDMLPSNRDLNPRCDYSEIDKADLLGSELKFYYYTNENGWLKDVVDDPADSSALEAWGGTKIGYHVLVTDHHYILTYYDRHQNYKLAYKARSGGQWQYRLLDIRNDNKVCNLFHSDQESVNIGQTCGWDSHNYTTSATSNDGKLHIVVDQHNSPLNYYHTQISAGSINSDIVPSTMANSQLEASLTYPQFIYDASGNLYFQFRNGSSGNGISYVYRYENGNWSVLTTDGLFGNE